jgi:hypothetical protein
LIFLVLFGVASSLLEETRNGGVDFGERVRAGLAMRGGKQSLEEESAFGRFGINVIPSVLDDELSMAGGSRLKLGVVGGLTGGESVFLAEGGDHGTGREVTLVVGKVTDDDSSEGVGEGLVFH